MAQLPARAEPRVVVECATCHRGVTLPKSLQTTLFEIVEKQGAPAAVAKYRELRADALLGHYNFGEWEINELARRLSEAGKPDAVIAILEMNGEFYPKSAEIDVHDRRTISPARQPRKGDRALSHGPRQGAAALQIAKQRLEELEKNPQ